MSYLVRLCCVGASHTEFKVAAVRGSDAEARDFMEREKQTVRKKYRVGFIAPWIVDGSLSEELDLEFVWDDRNKPEPHKPKRGVY